MRQVVPFNVNTAGTTKYLCLANVRKGYGIGIKYPDATTAWNNTQQHRDRNFPSGCAVPVFYSWTGTLKDDNGKLVTKNYGHIAVRLPDGRIWTDGRYYANVDELSAKYLSGSSYLGWGESVNGVKVVENVIIGGNMSGKIENNIQGRDGMRIINSEIKGWDYNQVHSGSLDAREMAAWTGQTWEKALSQGFAEGQAYRNLKQTQANFYNKYDSIIGSLESRPTKAQLEEAITKLNAETAKVSKAEAKAIAEELKAQGLAQELEAERAKEKGDSEDTKLLDSIKELIGKLVARFKN